jgi:hypothetical protein
MRISESEMRGEPIKLSPDLSMDDRRFHRRQIDAFVVIRRVVRHTLDPSAEIIEELITQITQPMTSVIGGNVNEESR